MKSVAIILVLLYSFMSKPARQNDTLNGLCAEFNRLNTSIRDGQIEKQKARALFQQLIKKIKDADQLPPGKGAFYFPVQHYSALAIGGKNGSGYIPGKYDYFDGNMHSGHAAHDIFIGDKNQDCLDDRTGKKVNVLSVSTGIVLAVENSWNQGSALRGGKYIWILSADHHSLFYYAHNDTVLVAPGQRVDAGQAIARVGRTGLNAHKQRSPTHLHFMQLELNNNNLPVAVNPYKLLIKAK
ncbi:MAG: M23 family metallopeptidase [Bacteroidota bacterium]